MHYILKCVRNAEFHGCILMHYVLKCVRNAEFHGCILMHYVLKITILVFLSVADIRKITLWASCCYFGVLRSNNTLLVIGLSTRYSVPR